MYNSHFRFREAPFRVTPDPEFYYSNQAFKKAWATLRFGIEARKGFIIITGEPGTGKTTLLRKTMHAFGSNIKTVYISDTLADGTDLLDRMLADLALGNSTENRSAMTKRLTHYLTEQFEQGNIVALLIDEAQKLSLEGLEELRCLSNLETDKDKLLQIVLAGQPELEQKLDQPELRQLKQRIVLRCRLKPITRDEVQPYMDSRLKIIGYRSEDLFDLNAIGEIASYSNGIPRLINIICDNALLVAYVRSARKVNAAMIDAVAENLRLSQSGEGQKPPLESTRQFSPIIGMSAILLLTALGVFLYPQELSFSVSGTDSAPEQETNTSAATQMVIVKQVSETPIVSEVKKFDQPLNRDRQTRPSRSTDFLVIGDSFVRSRPSPNAQIIATLTPGTRVQVTGLRGEYYGVRSRGTNIRGYVHKQDAFFERNG